MQARFIQEASIAASLEHPHILPIYHVGEQDGMVYIVMRCVDGKSLENAFPVAEKESDRSDGQDRSPSPFQPVSGMAPERVARLGIALCQAIGYAHGMGVLHCDIKPGNVLMGRPPLADRFWTGGSSHSRSSPRIVDWHHRIYQPGNGRSDSRPHRSSKRSV
jgi:serine/threonine protein kinase